MKEEYKECPNCHNMVDKLDTKCPYCLFSFLMNSSTIQDNDVDNEKQNSSTSFRDSLKNSLPTYKLDKSIIIKKVIIIIVTVVLFLNYIVIKEILKAIASDQAMMRKMIVDENASPEGIEAEMNETCANIGGTWNDGECTLEDGTTVMF